MGCSGSKESSQGKGAAPSRTARTTSQPPVSAPLPTRLSGPGVDRGSKPKTPHGNLRPNGLKPLLLEDIFPDGHCDGLRIVYPNASALVDIIFIHGLGGHPYETWSKDDTYWPTQLLPSDIPTARVLSFGYHSSNNTVFDHAGNLDHEIARVRKGGDKDRPIILIAHSLGGLVVKQAVLRSQDQLSRCVMGILFLGTPHRGSALAPFGVYWAHLNKLANKSANVEALKSQSLNSQELDNLGRQFGSWLGNRSNSQRKCLVACFVEEYELPDLGIAVDKDSGFLFSYHQETIAANHMDMVRFDNSKDNGYRKVMGVVRDWLESMSDTRSTRLPYDGSNGHRRNPIDKPETPSEKDRVIIQHLYDDTNNGEDRNRRRQTPKPKEEDKEALRSPGRSLTQISIDSPKKPVKKMGERNSREEDDPGRRRRRRGHDPESNKDGHDDNGRSSNEDYSPIPFRIKSYYRAPA